MTNRRLCRENFLARIKKIAESRPSAIILREKDLSPQNYSELAVKILKICAEHDVELILHNFVDVAINLGVKKIHLPFAALKTFEPSQKKFFNVIGASCHSIEELHEAQNFGCKYVTAGHIFATDCKKNLEPRGINFLIKIRDAAKIPVYAIGGINEKNILQIQSAGANGACIMSGFMTCENPADYLKNFYGA